MSTAISVKPALFESAANLLNERGYEAKVMANYSGRAMYDKTCPAIVTEAPATVVGACFMQACIEYERIAEDSDEGCDPDEAISNGIELAWEEMPKREDSMGRSSRVFY